MLIEETNKEEDARLIFMFINPEVLTYHAGVKKLTAKLGHKMAERFSLLISYDSYLMDIDDIVTEHPEVDRDKYEDIYDIDDE